LIARSGFAAFALAFLVYCLFWIVIHSAGDPPPGTVIQALTVVFSWFALLSVGAFLNIESRALWRILVFSAIMMGALIIVYSDGVNFIARNFSSSEDSIASYQGFARSGMITFIALLSIIRNTSKRIAAS